MANRKSVETRRRTELLRDGGVRIDVTYRPQVVRYVEPEPSRDEQYEEQINGDP